MRLRCLTRQTWRAIEAFCLIPTVPCLTLGLCLGVELSLELNR